MLNFFRFCLNFPPKVAVAAAIRTFSRVDRTFYRIVHHWSCSDLGHQFYSSILPRRRRQKQNQNNQQTTTIHWQRQCCAIKHFAWCAAIKSKFPFFYSALLPSASPSSSCPQLLLTSSSKRKKIFLCLPTSMELLPSRKISPLCKNRMWRNSPPTAMMTNRKKFLQFAIE